VRFGSLLAARDEGGGRRGARTRIAQQLGVDVDTLRGWVNRAEVEKSAASRLA
jgi:transposase